jgi:hypothetical protein
VKNLQISIFVVKIATRSADSKVEISPTSPTGTLLRPVIPVRLVGNSSTLVINALVDTGADETLLPRSVAASIGASLDASQRWNVAVLGGQTFEATLGEVGFELGGPARAFRWRAKIGFISFPSPEQEVVVLGHLGFLEYFKASFNYEANRITLTPSEKLRAASRA